MQKFNYKEGYTHSGTFHFDDVLSTVFLKKLNKDIIIHRVSEVPENISKESIVFDIGLGQFDHHQQNPKLNRKGSPYCAFGLLFDKYGKLMLKQQGFKNIDKAFKVFIENVVEKVDKGDNFGYNEEYSLPEQKIVKSFNPTYYDIEKDSNAENKQFFKACKMMELIFDNWLRQLYLDVELKEEERHIWIRGKSYCKGNFVILTKNIQWKQFAKEDPDVEFVIVESNRGGINVISTGKKRLIDNDLLTFLHSSKKFGVTKTILDAVEVCRNYNI